MLDFSQLIVKLLGDTSSFDKNFKASQRLLTDFGDKATAVGTKLTAAFTLPIAGLGLASLKAAGQMEQTNIAFKTMLGSATAAQAHLKELKEFALQTPFEFNDVTSASKKMMALGFAAKDVLPMLRTVGDAASALGMGAEGINRVTLALGQMKAKGTVQAQEMNQLAEVGINAWQILAKTLNTDVAGAMKMVERRAVDSSVAVPAILAGMNAKFAGAMEAQSKTMLGQWSNFKDKMTFTLVDIGNELAPTAKNLLKFADDMGAKTLLIVKAFAQLPDAIKTTSLAVVGLAAAAGPLVFALGQIAAALKNIRDFLPFLAAASKAAAPVGLAIGAGVATSKAQTASGVTVGGTFGGGSDALGIGKALNAEADALKILTNVRQQAAPVDKAAFDLSVKMAGSHKENAAVVKTLTEATRTYYFNEMVANEAHHRAIDAGKKVVSTFVDLITAGEKWGKKIEYVGSEIQRSLVDPLYLLGSAAAESGLEMNNLALVFGTGQVAAKQAEISLSDYKGTIFEVDAIMRKFGKNGPLALLETENATRKALERMIELYDAGKATADQVQKVGEVYAEAVKDRKHPEGLPKLEQDAKKTRQALLQVSTVVTDLSKGITKLMFEGGKWGDVMKKVALEIGESLVRNVIENGLMKISQQLLKMISKEFPAFGSALGKIFGGLDTSGKTPPFLPGTAGSPGIPGSSGGGGGSSGGSSGVGGAIGGWIGLGAQVVSAAGSIVQAFQLHGIGKDTGRMEESLRGILNVLALNGSESIHQFVKASSFANVTLKDYWQTTGHSLLVAMSSSLDVISTKGVAAGAGGITIQIYGGTYASDAASMDRFADDLARRIKERAGVR